MGCNFLQFYLKNSNISNKCKFFLIFIYRLIYYWHIVCHFNTFISLLVKQNYFIIFLFVILSFCCRFDIFGTFRSFIPIKLNWKELFRANQMIPYVLIFIMFCGQVTFCLNLISGLLCIPKRSIYELSCLFLVLNVAPKKLQKHKFIAFGFAKIGKTTPSRQKKTIPE